MDASNWLASDIPTDYDTSPTFYNEVRALCDEARRPDLVGTLSQLNNLADVKAKLLEAVSDERRVHPERFKPKAKAAPAKPVATGPQAIAATRSAPARKPQPSVNRVANCFTQAELLEHAAAESRLLRSLPDDVRQGFIAQLPTNRFICV